MNTGYIEKTQTLKNGKAEKKNKIVRKRDKRDDFIKKFGEKEFDKIAQADEQWNELKDLPFPKGTVWLFNHFYNIWVHCEVNFNGDYLYTPKTILEYETFTGVSFSLKERSLLLKMGDWARSSINKVKTEDDS